MFDVGKFAAMTAYLKLEHHGPFRGSEEDVIPFVARNATILWSTMRNRMEIGFHSDGIK